MITLRNVKSPSDAPSNLSLDAVSLTIAEGEAVTVTGLSSSCRRRLLSVLGLYVDDWSGEYELFGHPIHKIDDEARVRIRGELVGAMMRSAPLVDCLSVEENLEIPLSYRGVASRERLDLIEDALSRLGVGTIRDCEIGSLPADQQQLVGIAKALVSNPSLLLLEDPVANLSPLQCRLVSREIERLRLEGCIVVQSAESQESGLDSDRVIELEPVNRERRTGRRSNPSRSGLNSVASVW